MRLTLRLCQLMAIAAGGCLLALALVTIGDVVSRYCFGKPIPDFVGLSALATAVILAAFFPILLLRRGNISLRPFARIPSVARSLDAFGSFVTAVFFGLMAWKYVLYAAEVTGSGEHTTILHWPVGPWWWVVAALIAVTTIAAFAVLVDTVMRPLVSE